MDNENTPCGGDITGNTAIICRGRREQQRGNGLPQGQPTFSLGLAICMGEYQKSGHKDETMSLGIVV